MEKGGPVKAHGYIKAELYEGFLDNAVATIPGETDEEVIVIAHICHPEPSANDNASGCGAAMEAARAIKKLIDDGVLTKPKRTIRFTLVPEMAGSYSYLAEREEEELQRAIRESLEAQPPPPARPPCHPSFRNRRQSGPSWRSAACARCPSAGGPHGSAAGSRRRRVCP